MINLLFVCTGNTCRSPMAEAIVKHHAPGLQVKSAGVFAAEGSPTSLNTVEALSEQGISIEHSSKLLTKDLVEWANYVFTMTQSHKDLVVRQFPDALPKIYTVKEFAFNQPGDVIDPYGGSIEVYRDTFRELNESIKSLLKQLEQDHEK